MPQQPSRSLPDRPNLDHLKKQAKDLLHAFQHGDVEAAARFRALASTSPDTPDAPAAPAAKAADPNAAAAPGGLKLADALHVIANEYGFTSWPKLKARVEALARPFDPIDAMKTAVRAKDAAAVRRLFDEHPALKSRINEAVPDAPFGETLLIRAVQTGHRDMVDAVLDAGADINQGSHWWAGSFSVLDNAGGKPELVRHLLDRGARLDAPMAAGLDMFDALKALIASDPSAVNARGGDGQMPLHRAKTVEMAEFLLEHGAQIDARDIDHESTPAQYAIRERQDVARYLVSRGCWTDILMAAALGDRALVEQHLAADPSSIRTSVSDEYFPKRNPRAGGTIYIWTLGSHKTAHIVARDFKHEDIFRLLMDRSPDTLQLAVACELGDEASIARITARHPRVVQSLSTEEQRRLPRTAMNDNTRGVRLMLAAGWPVDAPEHGGGETALHWAAFHGNIAMTRDLLRHRAPIELKDRHFQATPLGWGLHGSEHGWHHEGGQYLETIEALLQAGAMPPENWEERDVKEPIRALLRRYSRP